MHPLGKFLGPGIASLVLVGCLDVRLHTQVHPDGSLTRSMVIRGDSSSMANSSFPLPQTEGWSAHWERLDEDQREVEYRKTFADAGEMNAEFDARDPLEPQIVIDASLTREFRWFFTDMIYREIHRMNNPLRGIPLTDYISGEEWESLLDLSRADSTTRTDSTHKAELEEQFNRWFLANEFISFYDLLIRAAALEGERPELVDSLISHRDGLLDILLHGQSNANRVEDFLEHVESALGDTTLGVLVRQNPAGFTLLDRKYQAYEEVMFSEYRNAISLPENIRLSNADTVDGVTARWEEYSPRLLAGEVNMWAIARHQNGWAWVVTILAILLLGWWVRRRGPRTPQAPID